MYLIIDKDLSRWYHRSCRVPGIGAAKYNNFLIILSSFSLIAFFSSESERSDALCFVNTLPRVSALCLLIILVATKIKEWCVTNLWCNFNKCLIYTSKGGFFKRGLVISPLPYGNKSGKALE